MYIFEKFSCGWESFNVYKSLRKCIITYTFFLLLHYMGQTVILNKLLKYFVYTNKLEYSLKIVSL